MYLSGRFTRTLWTEQGPSIVTFPTVVLQLAMFTTRAGRTDCSSSLMLADAPPIAFNTLYSLASVRAHIPPTTYEAPTEGAAVLARLPRPYHQLARGTDCKGGLVRSDPFAAALRTDALPSERPGQHTHRPSGVY
jgi:hypothetical protein